MDKIYIRDLEFIGYHGVFEEEKKLGQKFYLSLELSTDLREANDDITKTTHYGEVAELRPPFTGASIQCFSCDDISS